MGLGLLDDKKKDALQGKIDRLQKAADKLQGVAYDLQVIVESPVQGYDAGPSWQGSVRESFESKKSAGKDAVDGLRQDVDAARDQINDKISQLHSQQLTS